MVGRKSDERIRLAIILPTEKAGKIRLPVRIAKLCKERSIEVTVIDFLNKQQQNTDQIEGEYDVLLHKALDFLNEPGIAADEGTRLIQKVNDFIRRNPGMVVIDELDSCSKISDRMHCHRVMENAVMVKDGIEVFVPKSIEISGEGLSIERIRELLHGAEMRLPVLAKPMHTNDKLMSMVFSPDDAGEIRTPSLVQEFFNHSGVMYKVFVIGDRFHIIQRPSIKDFGPDQQKLVKLDSRDVSKMGRGFHPQFHHSDPAKQTWQTSFETPDLLNTPVVSELCKNLSRSSGLRLFGVDILVVKETGNYAIVDINQFPGYKGIPDEIFAEDFVEMVVKAFNGKNKNNHNF